MGNFKQNTLALSVMTGVTALVGGVEPATANPQLQFDAISLEVSLQDSGTLDPTGESSAADNFENLADNDDSSTLSFNLFDTMGGTRQLTQVSVTVMLNELASSVSADVSGNCELLDASGNSAYCAADAENSSEFSVVIDLNGQIPLNTSDTNPVTSAFEDSCDTAETSNPCNYGGNQPPYPAPPNFSITITDPDDLVLFSGPGTFNILSSVAVSGAYSATIQAVDLSNVPVEAVNNWGVSAMTVWNADVQVTYDFIEVPTGVPEPATLFLFGSGLAGLGLLRRRTDNKA